MKAVYSDIGLTLRVCCINSLYICLLLAIVSVVTGGLKCCDQRVKVCILAPFSGACGSLLHPSAWFVCAGLWVNV